MPEFEELEGPFEAEDVGVLGPLPVSPTAASIRTMLPKLPPQTYRTVSTLPDSITFPAL